MKRALLAVAVAVLLIAAGAGVAYYLHVKQQSRDVQGSSTVEFVTTETVATAAEGAGRRVADLRS